MHSYGTLGGLIALLVWFWISNLAILFGHQLNAERERSLEIEEGRPRAEREIQPNPTASPRNRRPPEMLLGIGALGTGVALAASEDLRSSLFGSASQSESTSEGS